jgi:hypothetical protein
MQEFHRKLVGISGPLAMQGFFLNPTYLLRKRTDFCNITVFPIPKGAHSREKCKCNTLRASPTIPQTGASN